MSQQSHFGLMQTQTHKSFHDCLNQQEPPATFDICLFCTLNQTLMNLQTIRNRINLHRRPKIDGSTWTLHRPCMRKKIQGQCPT